MTQEGEREGTPPRDVRLGRGPALGLRSRQPSSGLSQASRGERPGFFQAGSHFRPTFLTSGNLSSSFPEPGGFRHGTFHGSVHHIRSQVTGHPTDAQQCLADGCPPPSRGSAATTGSRPHQQPSPGSSVAPSRTHRIPSLQTRSPERRIPGSRAAGPLPFLRLSPFSSTTARTRSNSSTLPFTDDKLRPRERGRGLFNASPDSPAQRHGSLGPDSGPGLDSQQLLVGEKGRV